MKQTSPASPNSSLEAKQTGNPGIEPLSKERSVCLASVPQVRCTLEFNRSNLKMLPSASTARCLVIIFDWDDTLMASSFADRAKLLQTESFGSLPPALQAQFAQLEELVAKCLCAAAELGSVVIITNAEAGWVEVRVH
jgi:hypothetical protein